MENNDDLKILEEELYGINNAVDNINERLKTVSTTELQLTEIQSILTEIKNTSLESYDTKYNQITEYILKIQEVAKKIPYTELNEFDKNEIIPQGAISYNFNNINYNSLIMSLPKTPPISKGELKAFIKELDCKYSAVLLQISQLKSYKKKLEAIINKLSITAVACYLCS